MDIDKFLAERTEKIKHMTLADAREVIASSCSHYDMSIEFEKAVQMLLDYADGRIGRTCSTCKYYTHKTGNRVSKTKLYCNRSATLKMLPDDYCSKWADPSSSDSVF